MRLIDLTSVIWTANTMLDAGGPSPFSVEEFEAAGKSGQWIDLLLRLDYPTPFEFLAREEEKRRRFEEALGEAFEAMEGRFAHKAGISKNPLCLLIAVALEAIQQQFGPLTRAQAR